MSFSVSGQMYRDPNKKIVVRLTFLIPECTIDAFVRYFLVMWIYGKKLKNHRAELCGYCRNERSLSDHVCLIGDCADGKELPFVSPGLSIIQTSCSRLIARLPSMIYLFGGGKNNEVLIKENGSYLPTNGWISLGAWPEYRDWSLSHGGIDYWWGVPLRREPKNCVMSLFGRRLTGFLTPGTREIS